MKTHMQDEMRGFKPFAACNASIKAPLTDDINKVNCGKCMRTTKYREEKETNLFVSIAARKALERNEW